MPLKRRIQKSFLSVHLIQLVLFTLVFYSPEKNENIRNNHQYPPIQRCQLATKIPKASIQREKSADTISVGNLLRFDIALFSARG